MGTWFAGGSEPWERITKRVKAAKGRAKPAERRVLAAIAYVGVAAPRLLPLKRGDILVCDAEPWRVRAGSTSAHALETFFNRGVRIYSHRELHAKVVVLHRRAFVGSSNASTNSRDNLDEATLETTDTAAVRDARNFVEAMSSGDAAAFRLDSDDIATLLKIPVERPTPPPPYVLPREVGVLQVCSLEKGDWAKSTEQAFKKNRASVRSWTSKMGTGLRLEGIEWSDALPEKGHWILGVYKNGWVHPPAQVIRLTESSETLSIVWLATPKDTKSLRLSAVGSSIVQAVHEDEENKVVRGKDTVPLLAKFKK